jgi:hypothetical protein
MASWFEKIAGVLLSLSWQRAEIALYLTFFSIVLLGFGALEASLAGNS